MSEVKEHPAVARAAARALCTTLLDGFIEPVRRVARDAGYAITVHGSLARDIDLVAVPWVERAWSADALVDRVAATIASQVGRCNTRSKDGKRDWSEKPHGRRATTLMVWSDLFGHVDVDLSVMPATAKEEEK